MNSPEGFLPKKLNFTMQAVQVLWFRPVCNPSGFCAVFYGAGLSLRRFPHLKVINLVLRIYLWLQK